MPEQDPLAQLRDIHLPEAISAWPPAPGWWLLALVTLAALITVFVLLRRWHRRLAFRREAIRQLQHLDSYRHSDKQQYLQALNELLKRTALACHAPSSVAGLAGQDWTQFLNRQGNGAVFSQPDAELLATALYSNEVPAGDLQSLHQSAERWIKQQRARSQVPC